MPIKIHASFQVGGTTSQSDFTLELSSLSFGGQRPMINGAAVRASLSEIVISAAIDAGNPALISIIGANASGTSFSSVVFTFSDDGGTPYEIIELGDVVLSSASVGSGEGGGILATSLLFNTLKTTVITPLGNHETVIGGATDTVPAFAYTTGPDPTVIAKPVSGDKFTYKLKAAGIEIDLTGFDLDFLRPHSDQGVPSGPVTGSTLLAHAVGGLSEAALITLIQTLTSRGAPPSPTERPAPGAAPEPGEPMDILIEVRNTEDKLVNRLTLTNATIAGIDIGAGKGGSAMGVALGYATIAIEAFTTPGDGETIVQTQVALSQVPTTSVPAIGLAAHGEPGSGNSFMLTLHLQGGETIDLDLTGYDLDFAGATQTGSRSVSPLVVHVGGAPGVGGLARVLKAIATNTGIETAQLQVKDANGALLHQIELTGASVTAEALAGGAAGGAAAVAFTYDRIELSSVDTPGGELLHVFEDTATKFESYSPDLTVKPPIGAGYSYSFALDGRTYTPIAYQLDTVRSFDAASGDVAGKPAFSALQLQFAGKPGDPALGTLLNHLATNTAATTQGILEVRNASGEIVNRITLDGATVIAQAIGAGGGSTRTTVSFSYDQLTFDGWDSPGSAQPAATAIVAIGDSSGTLGGLIGAGAVGATAEGRDGDAVTYQLVLSSATGVEISLDVKGYDLNAVLPINTGTGNASGSATFSPLFVQVEGSIDAVTELQQALYANDVFTTATLESRDASGLAIERLTLGNASLVGTALAGGGGGNSSALEFTFDQLTHETSTAPGSLDATVTYTGPSGQGVAFGAAEGGAFGDMAKPLPGVQYTYSLTIGDLEVAVSGYELDSSLPFDAATGNVIGQGTYGALVLHVDKGPGEAALDSLLEALDRNGFNGGTAGDSPSAKLEVRDLDGDLITRLTLSDVAVQGIASSAGLERSRAAVSLGYNTLELESWDTPGSGDASATASITGSSEAGGHLFITGPTYAELATLANAAPARWVETLSSEVRDVFGFIRHGAFERAFGALNSDDGSTARGVSALAAGDLAGLSDVPILGDKIIPKIQAGIDVFHDLENRILDALANLPDSADAANLLADTLNGIGYDGLEAQADGTIVTIALTAGDTVAFNVDGSISIGNATLGLDLDASAATRLSATLNMLLQVDVETGSVTLIDNGGKEIELGLDAAVDFNANAHLGYLGIAITDKLPGQDEVQLDFGLDLPSGSIADLNPSTIGLSLDGKADLKLGFATTLPSSVLPTIAGDFAIEWRASTDPATPGLGETIAFRDVTLDLGGLFGAMANTFEPVLDLLDSYPLGDVLGTLTAPLPVIDTLARKAGVVGFFDKIPTTPDGHLSLLDVAAVYGSFAGGESAAANIAKFAEAIAVLQSFEGIDPDDDIGKIDLGDFIIAGGGSSSSALRALSLFAADDTPTITPDPTNPDAAAKLEQINQETADDNLFGNIAGTPGLSILPPFGDGFHDVSGLSIPILNDPTAAIKILLNQAYADPIALIQYDLPALEFAGNYQKFFPIWGPIGAVIEGGFAGRIDLAVGYDTEGLASGNLLDGIYLTTQPLLPGSSDREPVAKVEAAIGAGAGVSIGVGSAALVASIGATLTADLNDGGDGLLRYLEITTCILDPVSGSFTAELGITVKFGWGPFSWRRHITLVDTTLAEFAYGCKINASELSGLATFNPMTDRIANQAGELILNVGFRADVRDSTLPSPPASFLTDGVEAYAIRRSTIAGAYDVRAFGMIETFGSTADPATIITARFGEKNDSLIIEDAITIGSMIYGGNGEDTLIGGGGSDRFYGDNGDDVLNGSAGDDWLYGGADADTFEGGAGADHFDGGGGGTDYDQTSYESSAVGVTFERGVDENGKQVSIGHNGDAEGDVLLDIEYIIGSNFNDRLVGIWDDENTLEGLNGDDVLIGGKRNDFLLGGRGGDLLYGFAGEDGTSYLTSFGGVQVDLATGAASGGDATGDHLSDIEDVQGSAFDDALHGDDGANKLDGWYGDDVLEGRAGRDTLTGFDGNDTIYAGDDGDSLDGGTGRDLLSYEHAGRGVSVGLLYGSGGGDTVVLQGIEYSTFEDLDGSRSADADYLTGDEAANRIRGFEGDDYVSGAGGDDVLVGGLGADSLDGGEGRDLADYRDAAAPVAVNLLSHVGSLGEAEGDTLYGIEDLRGSDWQDTLIGDAGNNRIDPGLTRSRFSERVDGGDGIDTLIVDYSRGDTGRGATGGIFGIYRLRADVVIQLDGFSAENMDQLQFIGTAESDHISGGGYDDYLVGNEGNDILSGGGKALYTVGDPVRYATLIGADRILGGGGGDIVRYGVNENDQLAKDFGTLSGSGSPFHVFYLDGGAGTDTLDISLWGRSDDITLVGGDSVNLVLADGSAAVNFERLGQVFTASGNDVLGQAGAIDNLFDTGAGEDVITPGLGTDTVYGGTDFVQSADGPIVDFTRSGDLLVLDYSSLGGISGVVSTHGSRTSELATNDYRFGDLLVNTGTFTSSAGKLTYEEVERISVMGSKQADFLVGTENYSPSLYFDHVGSDKTQRGSDILMGSEGNDFLIGLSGSDYLDGGDGNDTLYGANPLQHVSITGGDFQFDDGIDTAEIDYLTGGGGADTFVLGDANGYFYGVPSPRANGENRAIITDLDSGQGDRIQLWAGGTYEQEVVDGDTYLYVRVTTTNRELIAQVLDTDGLTFGTPADGIVHATGTAASHGESRNAFAAFSALMNAAASEPAAASAEADVAPAALADWITPTAAPGDLGLLFDPASGVTVTNVKVEGNATSFGTITADNPFGFAGGVIVSTGNVTDLIGPNEEDGGKARPKEVTITFERVGTYDDNGSASGEGSTIYRASLSDLGFDIASLVLSDSNSRKGGSTGIFSGFDLDAVVLSTDVLTASGSGQITTDLNDPGAFSRLDAFSFDGAHLFYTPGAMRSGGITGDDLAGSVNGMVANGTATLGQFDAAGLAVQNARGLLTFGDGGSLGINLRQAVSTDGLYLYIAEAGISDEETLVGNFRVSDTRIGAPADLSTDFGLPGADHDTSTLEYTLDVPTGPDQTFRFDFLAFTEELSEFAGSAFNDTIKIKLNGVNLADLTDGAALEINNLMVDPYDPGHPDLILNQVGVGPLSGQIRADAYTRTLSFQGVLHAGVNTLTVEVTDVGDGLVDTGVILKAVSGGITTTAVNTSPYFVNQHGDGIALTDPYERPDLGGPSALVDNSDLVVDDEGRILTAGSFGLGGSQFVLHRYSADGVLDSGFGDAGYLVSGADGLLNWSSTGLTLQADGKLLIASSTVAQYDDPRMDARLYRYTQDGTADASFGSGGHVEVDVDTLVGVETSEVVGDVIALADGSILVAVDWVQDDRSGARLVRYTSDGGFDADLGALDGLSLAEIELSADGRHVLAAAVDAAQRGSFVTFNADGSGTPTIVAAGDIEALLPANVDFVLTSFSFDTAGNLLIAGLFSEFDPRTFRTSASAGFVRVDADGSIEAVGYNPDVEDRFNNARITVQPDGKIVVAGWRGDGENGDFGAARYNPDGSVDVSFGRPEDHTVLITVSSSDYNRAVAMQDDKILLAGLMTPSRSDGSSSRAEYAIVRLLPDGSLDTDFHGGPRLNGFIAIARGALAEILDTSVAAIDREFATAGHYNGASITLKRAGGANAEDIFGAGGHLALDGSQALLDGVAIGTVSQSGGTFRLVFNANATRAVVDETLSSLTYSNTTAGPAEVIGIEWTFSDGTLTAVGATGVELIAAPVNPINIIRGTPGDDILSGTPGIDQFEGLPGNDTYLIMQDTDIVVELPNEGTDTIKTYVSYTLGDNLENVVLDGRGNIDATGNAADNVLTGNDRDNTLIGGTGADALNGFGGNDLLDGGTGDDVLIGGVGDDTFLVDARGDRVIERVGGGDDLIVSVVDLKLAANIERLTLADSALDGRGNALDNVITGNALANRLTGGEGADTMIGGLGDDVYIVDNTGDRVIEEANGGTDRIKASIDYVLGDETENLLLVGAAVFGTGNALDNRIRGVESSQTLLGLGGDDILFGFAGDDTLDGGAANDILVGGAGRDILTGGDGRDVFRFDSGDLADTAANADIITDFGIGGGDRIDLHRIDAIVATTADDSFHFIGAAAFTNTAGELRAAVIDGNTLIQGDTNGDGLADLMLLVSGAHTLTALDFIGVTP